MPPSGRPQWRREVYLGADGQNLVSVLHTLYSMDRDFKNEVNMAMRTAFSDDFDEIVFPPAADQRIQLRLRWRSLEREQSAADLSDGTLRFLFLLAALANPSPPPLIAIDEPETGLHPSMLPIIAEYARDAAQSDPGDSNDALARIARRLRQRAAHNDRGRMEGRADRA